MKKIEFTLFSVFILLAMIPFGSAYSLSVKLVSQEPYPVETGEAVDLLFKADITNSENPPENLLFKIIPVYPFTLIGSEEKIKEFGDASGVPFTESFTFKYRVLVDENAPEGDSEIKVGYSVNEGKSYTTRDYNVTMTEENTDFDVVVQDLSDTSTTLAIVNIGASTGYSVIVRIPEQENFRVSGVSANVLGNVDAGDYTLASFQILPSVRGGLSTEGQDLKIEVSYTDALGIRRTVERQVKLDTVASAAGVAGTRMQHSQEGQFQISGNSGLTYLAIGAVGIVGIGIFLKFINRKKGKKK